MTGAVEVLLPKVWKGSNAGVAAGLSAKAADPAKSIYRAERANLAYFPGAWKPSAREKIPAFRARADHGGAGLGVQPSAELHPEALDALYLFGCFAEWEAKAEATPAWGINFCRALLP